MCPFCATSVATWLLAGALGSGGAAVVVQRRRVFGRATPSATSARTKLQEATYGGVCEERKSNLVNAMDRMTAAAE